MEGGIAQSAAPLTGATPAEHQWPSRRAAYYGLAVIIIATMMNFFDAQVFGLMAQRIKVDFHHTKPVAARLVNWFGGSGNQ